MKIRTIVSTFALLAILACGSTSFKTTWKDPSANQIPITGKKVVVVAMNVQPSVRRGIEEAVSAELRKLGAEGTPSFQILAQDATVGSAKAKLAAEGYDAAWVIRVTDKEKEVYSTPGTYAPYGAYGSYWGWGGGWGGAYMAPEMRTDTLIFVETMIYSVKNDKLAWSGLSETRNPSDIASFASELTRVAVAEMKKSGLLI